MRLTDASSNKRHLKIISVKKDLTAVLSRNGKPTLSDGMRKSLDAMDFSKIHVTTFDVSADKGSNPAFAKDIVAAGDVIDVGTDVTVATIVVYKDAQSAQANEKEVTAALREKVDEFPFGTFSASRSEAKIIIKKTLSAEEARKNGDKVYTAIQKMK